MKHLLSMIVAAVTLAAVSPSTGQASEFAMYDAALACPTLYEKWEINLPLAGSARYSQFYVRFNRGPWRSTTTYYTTPWVQYYWGDDARWHFVPFGSTPVSGVVGNNVLVEAYEYRYVNGWTWIWLGSCVTTSSAGGGISFGNG